MSDDEMGNGINRRQLITGMGAAAATTIAAGAAAESSSDIPSWDIYTDVLVGGSGAAGMSAAIEARAAGAEVLVIESLSKFGGSSAMSGGVVYAGGGPLYSALWVSKIPPRRCTTLFPRPAVGTRSWIKFSCIANAVLPTLIG